MGIGDAGVVVLASVVSQGHFEELKRFSLADNDAITDQAMIVLAQAIDAYAGHLHAGGIESGDRHRRWRYNGCAYQKVSST